MATNDKMTIDEVYKHLRKMHPYYQKSNRVEKGRPMNKTETVTDRQRRSLIRLLRGRLERQPWQQQRSQVYQSDFDQTVAVIYESYGRICAERLHPNLLELAEQLASHGELVLTEKLKVHMATVNLTTVHERLWRIRQDEPQVPHHAPRSPNPFLQDIRALSQHDQNGEYRC